MPEQRGQSTNTAAGKLARTALLYVGVGLIWTAVIAAAIALGWKLSRGGMESLPIPELASSAASVKPANAVVTDAERQEVLKRIDLMPNVSAENKERLYAYVERAQKLKRVMSVGFEPGAAKLNEAAIRKIVEESKAAEFSAQARDPAVVFVVLGCADKKGDAKKDLQLSLDRAGHVMDVLRKRCGVLNLIQTVPMNGSEFFNPHEASANRAVEVWAVLP